MGCTSSRLQQEFEEPSSYPKLPTSKIPRTGAKIPYPKAKTPFQSTTSFQKHSPKPSITTVPSWTTSSTLSITSLDPPQHPPLPFDLPQPPFVALQRKPSSRLRVILDADTMDDMSMDIDFDSPVTTSTLTAHVSPPSIPIKSPRRFESLARRPTPPLPAPSMIRSSSSDDEDEDLTRIVSLGQFYMQIDRGSRDGELSDLEVEAMVAASDLGCVRTRDRDANGKATRARVWYATQ